MTEGKTRDDIILSTLMDVKESIGGLVSRQKEQDDFNSEFKKELKDIKKSINDINIDRATISGGVKTVCITSALVAGIVTVAFQLFVILK